MVQHHGDFCDGYRQLEDFVSGLHRIEPKLAWGPLSDQLMRSCMMRSRSERSMDVRFFTSRFRFKNAQPTRAAFTFSKEEPEASAITRVVIDGMSAPFSVKHGLLSFEHEIEAGQAIDVRVEDGPRRPAPTFRPHRVTHALAVSARRVLSEFRDNALAKHPRLLAAATGVATRMKVTGNSGGSQTT
jgi:hypothetical protein